MELATPDPLLFRETAEKGLFDELSRLKPAIENAMANRDYATAMQDTSQLKQSVDDFFDHVMVMDEDLALRHNRLALLHQVNTLCCGTAELGLLRPEDTRTGHNESTIKASAGATS